MKLYTTLLLMAAGCSVVFAETVSEEQALANAMKFIEQNGSSPTMSRSARSKPKLVKAMQSRGFYAFNIGDQADGYIISSASDLTQPVLGYSDHGRLDPANMPAPLKFWLVSLETAIENIEDGIPQKKMLKANSVKRVADKKAIAPLVTCKWNQGDPYNLLTPPFIDEKSGAYNEHSATGCVATATTQIMYYWKWPQEACATIPSYEYDWSGNRRVTEELPPLVFKWDDMTDTYDEQSSQKSKIAVSELMLYAGHGMQSGYAGATGATSDNALRALQNYFGYSKDAYNAYHLNYTFQEWEDLFYNELAAGRPLLMGADNYERTGGHEFVCDGYDGNGLYHINWGWGGWDDGYFVLTVMDPDNQGIGGSNNANGYSMGQNVCVNLHPATDVENQETVHASISSFTAGQSKLRKDAEGNFSLKFSYNLHNLLMHTYELDHAFRLVSADDEVVADELAPETHMLHPANRYSFSASIKLQNLTDGTYSLKGISKLSGSEEWIYDENSDRNYIELEVNGDEMAVSVKPGQGTKLVINSLRLEGATVAGEWQKVVYNITNAGNDFYGETYMFVDGVRSSGNTISIPSGATADIYFKFKPSNNPGIHKFILSRDSNTDSWNILSEIDRMYNIDCIWKADGTISTLPKTAAGTSYVVPEEAVALYLYGSTPRGIAVSSANPNLVLYLNEDATLTSRIENIMRKYITNIVIGDKAKVAAFTDGHSAYIPMPFVAEKVSYTRENMTRWNTVALPFDVDEITVEGESAYWFTSKTDVDKNLFVKRFAGNRGLQVRFSHTEEIKANTPYFVGLKGDLNGSAFDHIGKSVTFSATDALVSISGETTHNFVANNVKMLPCYATNAKAKLLGLDEALENFAVVEQTKPFHAYLSSTSNASAYTIFYDEGEISGIGDVVNDNDTIYPDAPVYSILGIKVGVYADFDKLSRGIYIVSGKKIVKP